MPLQRHPFRAVALLTALAFASSLPAQTVDARFPNVAYEENVQYGTGGGLPLVMDIARPKEGEGPFPAVVCIHGGGWRGGDKAGYTGAILNLAQRGYVAVTVQYRFAPQHKFPAQVNDVKCAVRYLRAHAKQYKIDVDHIGAMGGSAGGHLALMLGTTTDKDGLEGDGGWPDHSSRVQVVGTLAGPTDLTRPFPELVENMLVDLCDGTRDEKAGVYKKASPLHHLSADDAPVFAIHGTVDQLVPYDQATSLVEACHKAKVEATLVTIQDGDHGSGGNIQDWLGANVKMFEFFDKHLKAPSSRP